MISLRKVKSRDLIIGFLVIVVLVSAVVLFKKEYTNKNNNIKLTPNPTNSPLVESKIRDLFKGIDIPVDANKTDLIDVSGGDGFGIVTSTEVLANLPELSSGEAYKVSLLKGESLIQLGSMRNEKGGWILEYDFSKFAGYKVVVTKGAKHILEGSL